MCRIMFSLINEKNKKWTGDLYRYLEKSLGGHGNGVAYIHNKNMKVIKARHMTCAECVDEGIQADNGIALFHTRRASTGVVSTENCQPFFIDKKRVLVQNGTWSHHKEIKQSLMLQKLITVKDYQEWTDARTIAFLIGYIDESFLSIIADGVFLIYDKTKKYARVFNYDGSFQIIKRKGIYYYASEFNDIYKEHWDLKGNTIMDIHPDGYKIVLGEIEKKYTRRFVARYGSSSYDYFDYYNKKTKQWKRKKNDTYDDGEDDLSIRVEESNRLVEEQEYEFSKTEEDKKKEEAAANKRKENYYLNKYPSSYTFASNLTLHPYFVRGVMTSRALKIMSLLGYGAGEIWVYTPEEIVDIIIKKKKFGVGYHEIQTGEDVETTGPLTVMNIMELSNMSAEELQQTCVIDIDKALCTIYNFDGTPFMTIHSTANVVVAEDLQEQLDSGIIIIDSSDIENEVEGDI